MPNENNPMESEPDQVLHSPAPARSAPDRAAVDQPLVDQPLVDQPLVAYPAVAQPAGLSQGQALDLPAAYGLQMKSRSPFGVWLLGGITFGIYGLVYWYKIHSELAEFDQRRHINPVFELMSIWLLSWTLVLPFMSIGGLAGKIRHAQDAAGLPQACSGLTGILLAFLFGTHVIYYQAKLNGIVQAVGTPTGERILLKH